MTENKIHTSTSGVFQGWLITLSILFVSFCGTILAMICIYALPDKSVRPFEGSLFFLGSSVILIVLLFLRWKKEKVEEVNIKINKIEDETPKIIIKESISDKVIKWITALFCFGYAWLGFVVALICIYALPDKTSQPKIGITYFLGSAIVIGSFTFVVWKNWIAKKP
jgi:hypothetical protein